MERILVSVLVVLLAAACGGPPTPTPDVVATLVAEELAVAGTLTALVPTATSVPPTPTPVPPIPTPMPPTSTSVPPTLTPTPRPPIPTVPPTAMRPSVTPSRRQTVGISSFQKSFSSFEQVELWLEFVVPAGQVLQGTEVAHDLSVGTLTVVAPSGKIVNLRPFSPEIMQMKDWLSMLVVRAGIGLPGLQFEALPGTDGGLLFLIPLAEIVGQPEPGLYLIDWHSSGVQTNTINLQWDGKMATVDGALVPPTATDAATPGLLGAGERIAFQSDRDGTWGIYVMYADGSAQTCLTDNQGNDSAPAWSPDGQHIAFTSDRDGNAEIYVMSADGSGQTNLTEHPASDWEPVWSPDGKQIAFQSDRDGAPKTYLMNIDGGQVERRPVTDGFWRELAWAPDGERIAFTGYMDGNTEIYVQGIDRQTRYTRNSANDGQPDWSPDGKRIAFTSDRDGNAEIYVMPEYDLLDERYHYTGQISLTHNLAADEAPAWSPDGERIAFQSDRDGNWEIYVMNADGSGQTNLTQNAANDQWPTWSPP